MTEPLNERAKTVTIRLLQEENKGLRKRIAELEEGMRQIEEIARSMGTVPPEMIPILAKFVWSKQEPKPW